MQEIARGLRTIQSQNRIEEVARKKQETEKVDCQHEWIHYSLTGVETETEEQNGGKGREVDKQGGKEIKNLKFNN